MVTKSIKNLALKQIVDKISGEKSAKKKLKMLEFHCNMYIENNEPVGAFKPIVENFSEYMLQKYIFLSYDLSRFLCFICVSRFACFKMFHVTRNMFFLFLSQVSHVSRFSYIFVSHIEMQRPETFETFSCYTLIASYPPEK